MLTPKQHNNSILTAITNIAIHLVIGGILIRSNKEKTRPNYRPFSPLFSPGTEISTSLILMRTK